MRPATSETIHKEAIKAIEDRIEGLNRARTQYRKQAREHTEIAMQATREAITTDEKIGVLRHTIRCLEGEFKAHGEAVNPSGFGPEGSGSNPDAPAIEPSNGFVIVEADRPE